METGRAKHHNIDQRHRQNFVKRNTVVDGCSDGYIPDPNSYKSQWQTREDDEKAVIRARRIKICKRLLTICFMLAVLVIVVLIVINVASCTKIFWDACPRGCNKCQFELDQWLIKDPDLRTPGRLFELDKVKVRGVNDTQVYVAAKEHCGEPLYFTVAPNSLKVTETPTEGLERNVVDPIVNVAFYKEEVEEKKVVEGEKPKVPDYFGLTWAIDKTTRNNESITIEFADNGTSYTGLGDFAQSIFKNREPVTHTLWTTKEDPTYLPYYLTFNEQGAVCMFLYTKDSAPLDVKILNNGTAWTVYSKEFTMHYYSGPTAYKALLGCFKKWNELYSFSSTVWTENIIFGSTNTEDIKAAMNTTQILATHYVLSAENIQVVDNAIKVKGADVLDNLKNVFLTWSARTKVNPAKIGALNNSHILEGDDEYYYLDYSNAGVQSWLKQLIKSQDVAGFLLSEGYLPGDVISGREEEVAPIKPVRATLSRPYNDKVKGFNYEAREAFDEDVTKTCTAKSKPQEEGEKDEDYKPFVYVKIDLGKVYSLKNITLHSQYYTDWYKPDSYCVQTVENYEKCKGQRTDVEVEVFRGHQLQGKCGTFVLGLGLDEEDQTYEMDCELEGDILLLSKKSGYITIAEIVIMGREVFYCHEDYLYCDVMDIDKATTPCSGVGFGDNSTLFYSHNVYDKERSDFINEVDSDALILQSAVSPGVTHFFRSKIEASYEGLERCFKEMVNLQLGGVYGYVCNLCGGVVLKTGTLCERWAELAFLMPHIVMVNDTVFPIMADGSEPGRYVQNKLNIRKKYKYYLEAEFYKAQEVNAPFLYPVSMTVQDNYDDDTKILIGESLFFAPVLDSSISDQLILFPNGSDWLQISSGTIYIGGLSTMLSGTTAIDNLLFFKIGTENAFILDDEENEDSVHVHILPTKEAAYEVEKTLTIYKDGKSAKLTITIPGTNDKIEFVPDGGENFGIKVSKLFVYQWFEPKADGVPDWIEYSPKPGKVYDIVFDFKTGGKEIDLMTAQSIMFVDGGSGEK